MSELKIQNPVLKGQFADPDLVMFNDKWYIYPTSDGFEGWSGTKFYVFESEDGVNFEEKGLIVDVASNQVPWSTGSAWAPCACEKDNKFYFYFCAKDETGSSCIGVASSDSPTGPFVAESKPMLTMEMMKEHGIEMWQTIDPSIIKDGNDYYIAFGNGQPAIVKLNDDMVSVDTATLKNIKGAEDFRESIIITKRDNKYHFTWSCDDTGSENYHVNYGTSDSIYGPITYHYPVLEKDVKRDILGTGHHSILKIANKDEYMIAYHRFVTPSNTYTKGHGFHRETCLARLEFDENNMMKKVEMPN